MTFRHQGWKDLVNRKEVVLILTSDIKAGMAVNRKEGGTGFDIQTSRLERPCKQERGWDWILTVRYQGWKGPVNRKEGGAGF